MSVMGNSVRKVLWMKASRLVIGEVKRVKGRGMGNERGEVQLLDARNQFVVQL